MAAPMEETEPMSKSDEALCEGSATDGVATDAEGAAVTEDAQVETSPEECVVGAESYKDEGNNLLKAGQLLDAVSKYASGIELVEPLLVKDPTSIGVELHQRACAVNLALLLNSAQACLKEGNLEATIEHTDKALRIAKDNSKALYRRAMACLQIGTIGRLEQARIDLTQFVQLEPSNREARDQLAKTKDRLKAAKQLEKERYGSAFSGGGLYQDQHKKHVRQQVLYEEEVARRQAASETEVSFEDWQKIQKENEEKEKTKEKEAREERAREEQKRIEQAELDAENAQRKQEGQEELTLEAFQLAKRKAATMKEDVVQTTELDLDEDEKKLLSEAKQKGYYHGRLGTVRSDNAPKPQQLIDGSGDTAPNSDGCKRMKHSEWNEAGTWEETDTTAWAKEEVKTWINKSCATSPRVLTVSQQAYCITSHVTSVNSVNGDAQMVVVRKKLRHGFNFDADASFKITFTPLNEGEHASAEQPAEQPAVLTFKGKLQMPEISDMMDLKDLRVDVSWKGTSPSDQLRHLASTHVDKLVENVRAQIACFAEVYRNR